MTMTGLLLAPLLAFQANAACTATVAPPIELAAWPRAVAAGAGAAERDAPALITGTAIDARLLPSADLLFTVAPAKQPAAGTSGGVFVLTVDRPGRYRVALGAGAWVDVIRDGKALASAAHGHGPMCSGVRKMVDYDLVPGRYVVQVAGSPQPALRMMVARLP